MKDLNPNMIPVLEPLVMFLTIMIKRKILLIRRRFSCKDPRADFCHLVRRKS